jgi:hypothetical protein
VQPLSLFYPEDGGVGFCVILLSVRIRVVLHQKTVMFITTTISALFHAYVQEVSCGVEHISVFKKGVH